MFYNCQETLKQEKYVRLRVNTMLTALMELKPRPTLTRSLEK